MAALSTKKLTFKKGMCQKVEREAYCQRLCEREARASNREQKNKGPSVLRLLKKNRLRADNGRL